jgi:transposase
LSEAQEEQLADKLDDYLYEDVKLIIEWVSNKYGVTYTRSGMRDLLNRLGFVYKQTKGVSSKADESKAS